MPSYPAHTAVLWGLQEAHLSGQGKDRGNEAGCVRSLERLCPSQNMDFLNLSPMLSAYKRLKDRLGRHWNTSTESQHCCGPSLLSDCSRKSIPVWETWSCQAAIPSTDTSKSPRKSMEMNSLSSAAASPWAKINSLLCMQSMCWHVLYSWQRSASGVTCQSLICLPLINVASSWTPRASSRGLLSLQARERGALSVLLLHFNTGSSSHPTPKRSWMQLHQHNPPELWLLKRPRDGVLPRPVAQHEEEKEETGNMGWPQCFKGLSSSQFSLCCFTLFVLSWIGWSSFWLPSQPESLIKQIPPVLAAPHAYKMLGQRMRLGRQWLEYSRVWKICGQILRSAYSGTAETRQFMKFDHHRAAGDTWGVAGNPSAPEAIWKLKVCTQDRAPGRCVCIHSSCITTALPALSEEMCWGQQGSTAISSSSYLTRAFSGTTLQGVASQDCLDWERDVLPPVLFRTPLCSEICPQTTCLFWVPHHSNFFPFPSTPNLHYLLSTSYSFFSIPWHFILAQRASVSSGATVLHKRDCPKMQLLCWVIQAEVTLCHTLKTSTHNNRITEYITVPYSPTESSANAYVHKLFTGWLSNTLCLNFISVSTSTDRKRTLATSTMSDNAQKCEAGKGFFEHSKKGKCCSPMGNFLGMMWQESNRTKVTVSISSQHRASAADYIYIFRLS